MHLLVVAATAAEVVPLASSLGVYPPPSTVVGRLPHPRHELDLLVTGVGMVPTAVWLTRALIERRPQLALNLGVCGSFDPALPPGSVVHVTSDGFAELGAEDGEGFLSVQDLGLIAPDEPPFRGGRLENAAPAVPAIAALRAARGITVSTVHGHEPSIREAVTRWSPDVESMEGAAFFYACMTAGVPCAQVRAVSNRVERRNRAAWKLDEAVAALSTIATRVLAEL